MNTDTTTMSPEEYEAEIRRRTRTGSITVGELMEHYDCSRAFARRLLDRSAVIVDEHICRHCGEQIWLDRSDTGPGGWLANLPWPHGRTLLCEGFDDQREHEPIEEES